MRRPPLQLPAVVFSAGRFTPTQADASRAQNPVTANPEESILKGVGDVMSYPQRRMVEAITGTYQDPSAALGIQNPVAAFATDVVLDPTNAIPAGALAKLFGRGAKVAGAADNAVDLSIQGITRNNLFKGQEYLDGDIFRSIVPENSDSYRVSTELRNRIESNVEEGNEWLKKWYSQRTEQVGNLVNPELKFKLEDAKFNNDNLRKELFKLELANFDRYTKNLVDDAIANRAHQSILEPTNYLRLNSDVSGVSSRDFKFIEKYSDTPKPLRSSASYNYVLMTADQNPIFTAIHEGTHGMDRVLNLTKNQHDYQDFDFSNEVFESIKGHSPNMPIKRLDYYSDPREIYARTNELRYMANLDPKLEVTEEMAKELLRFDNLSKADVGVVNTFTGIKPSSLARWMNTMPALAGAAMIGNQTQKK